MRVQAEPCYSPHPALRVQGEALLFLSRKIPDAEGVWDFSLNISDIYKQTHNL
jgi:hypothetical protein